MLNRRISLAVLCLILTTFNAFAQRSGEITGAVTDASGAVIPGVTVIVTNTATNTTRTAVTSETGNYTVPFLDPGTYNIRVELAGFRSATRTGLILQVGDATRVNFTMQLGEITDQVTVESGSVTLQTENAATGTVIDNKRIVELPLNGRNFLQLVKLSPNVTAEMGAGGQADGRQGGDRANQALSIAGMRQQFNRFTLDGVENTDVNFNTFIIRPSVDAIQEFKVMTGVYSAEFGRAPSQINATTKSGTNEFHGSLFHFHRNDNLQARQWQQHGDKNPFIRNQFGATVGGPIIREKLFFLGNFEFLRDRTTSERRATVATQRMRGGDFSAQGRRIFDPATRQFATDANGNEFALSADPFPNNIIPGNRIHPVAVKLLEFYPEPTRPGDDLSAPNYLRDAGQPQDYDQYIGRIDYHASDVSHWSGRFSFGDEFLLGGQTFPAQVGSTATRVYQTTISNTYTISPSVVNEFRAGYNQFQNDQLLHFARTRDVTAELGIPGLESPIEVAWGTPSIGLGDGVSGFGESSEGPHVNRNHTFQFMDNISWVRGDHAFKFGGEIARRRYNAVGNQFPRGSFIFQNQATCDPNACGSTGHAFASFLLGESRRSERALGLANIMLRQTAIYAYFEDTWKVTPRLTLTLGIRYENTPNWVDKYRGMMNVQFFDPGVTPDGKEILADTRVPIFTRPGAGDFHEGMGYHFHDAIPTQSGDGPLGRALIANDHNDFAPRIGIAYRPSDKWVLRTGFGVFYAVDIGNTLFDNGRNLGGRGRFESDLQRPNSNLSDPWAFERAEFLCSNWDGPCLGPPYTLAQANFRRSPYVQQWMLNVQRQLTGSLLLEFGYQGNAGRKLQRMRAYNEAVERTGPDDHRTIPQRQPWPAYGRIQVPDNVVNSNYDAFNVKLQERFAKGLTYLVGFTWSKGIDNGSAVRTNVGDTLFAPSSYQLDSQRALSQFHTGRRFIASVVYEIPFRTESRILSGFLSGWQLGSIVTFSDGTPYNVGFIGDSNNTGNDNAPDATGINPHPDQPTAQGFWNVEAFDATNPELQWRTGNSGRNTLIGPDYRNWDFSLAKNFRITEGQTLQFRFESFNFTNHPNWNAPARNPRAPNTFGVVTSAGTMRQNQFALKYLF